jgi:hypothetical protein
MSVVALERQYSLLIPTYNRPAHLARLLRFLERQQATFRIAVLDSSAEEARRANREAVRASGCDVRHLEFDSAIPPFEKFWRGAMQVETPFASFHLSQRRVF